MRDVVYFNDVFDTMTYPAGEPHVRLRPGFIAGPADLHVVAEAYDWNDLMNIKIADAVFRNNGITATFVVPYMPFARHDRKNDNNESIPILHVFGIMAGTRIVTIDPHSDVSGAFPHIPQSEVVGAFLRKGLFECPGNSGPVIAIPDAGAAKKAYSWLAGMDVVQCLKTRDPKTGRLSGFQVVDPEGVVAGRDVVIVDDICDGGGTFNGLANELYGAGALNLRLAVSHGIFTKGIDVLTGNFEKIYTLDTYQFAGSEPELVTVSTADLIMDSVYF